jgi:lipoyl(octanoyl) transferase
LDFEFVSDFEFRISDFLESLMQVEDLGTMGYRDAWALQERVHAEVVAGAGERVLLVEHPPVITFGRRPGVERNVVAPQALLDARGVETVPSDRGGDVTFHGPGQLVAYPIIRLIDHRLSVGGYVNALERAVIDALARFDVPARKDDCAVGVWAEDPPGSGPLAKVCAIGVRVRRGVTLHGLALNVTTDLSYFDLIVPCGLVGRPVTSLGKLLGDRTPSMAAVKVAVSESLRTSLSCVPPPAEPRRAVCREAGRR